MLRDRYLELLKSSLLNELYVELEAQLLYSVLCAAEEKVMGLNEFWDTRGDTSLLNSLQGAKKNGDTVHLEVDDRLAGRFPDGQLRNFTEYSYTLVGRQRLDHLQSCIEQVLRDDVPGDLLEAGVWRGGCSIFMRAVLAAFESHDRKVWVCDSFAGLPESKSEPDMPYAMSAEVFPFLAVPEDQVRDHFRRYGLLDSQVVFVPGWFDETLKSVPAETLAILRVDADLYESNCVVLEHLYDRVPDGGWVIIDDYAILPPCKLAVDQFRARRSITAPLQVIDGQAVCWQVET